MRKKFAIQKQNGNDMILCNWLATFWEEEGDYAELKNNVTLIQNWKCPSQKVETTQKDYETRK